MTAAYASYDISYSARTPYLTAQEYNNAPTSLDTTNLIPGGNAQANQVALVETINRASSWIDQFTCGAWGTLCATSEVENGRIWGSYRNTLIVHPKYWPIIEVSAFSYSSMPGGLASNQAASITPAGNVTIYPQQFEVAFGGTQSFGPGLTGFGGYGTVGIAFRTEYDCQWTYVCGWPNTTLAASVSAGATSIQPSTVTGILPGSMLTLYDLPYDEPLTVALSYVPGNATVPLTSPLQYDHDVLATVTNLPPAIKQAAILATTAFIKQRGSGALIAANIGEVTSTQTGYSQNSGSDWAQAKSLLAPFVQRFVGY